MDGQQIFVLSPASCSGKRAQLLLREPATFELAKRLQSQGTSLGEVFSFISGLYFRGKRTYANAFARPPEGVPGVWVISGGRGLLPIDWVAHLDDLKMFAEVPIDVSEPRYSEPLISDINELNGRLSPTCRAILLGSIATTKYTQLLSLVFGQRLLFPQDFVGRGDMSRGGLMLRAAAARKELEYVPIGGTKLHGTRPPKLPRNDRLARSIHKGREREL